MRIPLHLSILLAMLTSTSAWATLTIDSVQNASASTTTGTVTIYGGIAGPASCTGSTTCDNCAAASAGPCPNLAGNEQKPFCQCSKARITGSTILVINLKESDPKMIGNALATATSGTSTTPINVPINTTSNGGKFIDISWSNICLTIAPGTCEQQANSATLNLTIFIDKNPANGVMDTGEDSLVVPIRIVKPTADYQVYGNPVQEGVGAFKPYPGDGKVYLENVQASPNFPNLTGYSSQVISAQVYIAPGNLDAATVSAPIKPEPLALADNGGTFNTGSITGLDNDKLYFMRLAMIDQANNVVQFFPGNLGAGDFGGSCSGTTATAACPYSFTPSQVLGLLSKDVNCFIATAAYGTPLEPKLTTFREFRYKVLLRHPLGKQFVLSYYQYGPYVARFIADKPLLRAVARGFLWPLFGLSWLALRYGIAAATALTLLVVGLIFTLAFLARRRPSARV